MIFDNFVVAYWATLYVNYLYAYDSKFCDSYIGL